MLRDRLQAIATFIDKHQETSYREIAESLHAKERQVRYDIDRMNDVLIDQTHTLIEKYAKGKLVYQGECCLSSFFESERRVYTATQRVYFILLIALFDIENFHIKKLCDDFDVSRSSIKNDMQSANERLQSYGCELYYNKQFEIRGSDEDIRACMVQEFTKYIYIYGRARSQFNAYEQYARDIFDKAYQHKHVKHIITWIKESLEEHNIVMSDKHFRWYIASVCVYIWHILHGKQVEVEVKEHEIHHLNVRWNTLESYMGLSLTVHQKQVILQHLNYIQYDGAVSFDNNQDEAYRIVCELISKMTYRMKFDFGNDDILFDGLMNHVQPLLQRMKDHVSINEKELPLLNDEEVDVLKHVMQCVNEVTPLMHLHNESEKFYITMHFIAGLKRRDSAVNKRILLVCGLGYAIQKLIEETLQSEFQIEIIDTIPSYKLQTYMEHEDIDFVVSVMNVEIEWVCPIIFIHPFLKDEDYETMSKAGIKRKRIIPNLFGVYSRLDFLQEEDQQQVMDIMQSELGLRAITFYKKLNSLRDVLRITNIKILAKEEPCTSLFDLKEAYVNRISKDNMKLYKMNWNTQEFYLYHTIIDDENMKTKMYMTICGQTLIHICIISRDALEQVPAYQELYVLLHKTDFLQRILQAENIEDVYQNMLYCRRFIY